MMGTTTALLATLPWLVLPPVAMARVARSRSLTDVDPAVPENAPRVSVVLPARNEARNIARCVGSMLASSYPDLEIIVVDDHSTDGTGDLARAVAAADARVRVIESPPLPPGWFGKQWACATGAGVATGTLLLFIDADTWHAPDLIARAVNALQARDADLLSVAGRQELHSFWERVLQPQVFFMLLSRYGGTESVSAARRVDGVIATGQFLMIPRPVYDRIGGHAAVHGKVAEDLALAHRVHRTGGRVAMMLGDDRLLTHMYASLGELRAGWGKNIFAGGLDAIPGGPVGRALLPILLPMFPLAMLAPVIGLVLALLGVLGPSWLLWAAVTTAASVVWWGLIYRGFLLSPLWALAFPLGGVVLLSIIVGAIGRGRRVTWKDRTYVSR